MTTITVNIADAKRWLEALEMSSPSQCGQSDRLYEQERQEHRAARLSLRQVLLEANGGKTGWPPGMLQDDSTQLSKWLAGRPDARREAREAALDKMAENARELGLGYE